MLSLHILEGFHYTNVSGGKCVLMEEHPLSQNSAFKRLSIDSSALRSGPLGRLPLNLIAYDGADRLLLWNSREKLLHFMDVLQPDHSNESSSRTLLSHQDFKTLELDVKVGFEVRLLTINRRGNLLILAGDDNILFVLLHFRTSVSVCSSITSYCCRAASVGRRLYDSYNIKAARILQVEWHPYSDTHLGVLSSDAVFRLFDLSTDGESPEQEFYIQPQLLENSHPATYARPVAFAFGGDHLWDRFSVFILFSNGFVYVICPVAPFGSMFNSYAIEELHKDAKQWASASPSIISEAPKNSSLGASWLESVFPSLVSSSDSSFGREDGSLVLKANVYVPIDASLLLQGPLPIVTSNDSLTSIDKTSHATVLLYNKISKDSILAVGFLDGQMHLYALADEVQPMWNEGNSPRLEVRGDGSLLSLGMLVETSSHKVSGKQMFMTDGRNNGFTITRTDGVWEGHPPPLLQLAVIDFALTGSMLEAASLSILSDVVIPERLYCYHAAGLDAIVLHWLPFTDQSVERVSAGKPPSIYPIIDTRHNGNTLPSPLLGVAEVLDSFGEVWLIVVTASCECAVVEMKVHKVLSPLYLEGLKELEDDSKNLEHGIAPFMSKELLLGPKDVPLIQTSHGGSLSIDSIEGRAFLHDQCKLLHENFIEYAHRAYLEITSRILHLHKTVQEQFTWLNDSQIRLFEAQRQSNNLSARIDTFFDKNKQLEKRIKKLCSLQTARLKPLTTAEQEFKSQLDLLKFHYLDMLHSSVDMLKKRTESYLSQVKSKEASQYQTSPYGKLSVPDVQMRRLKASVDQLTNTVQKAATHLKTLDGMVKKCENLSIH